MNDKKIISVELPAEAYDRLKKKAESVNESMASLASKALDKKKPWQPIDRRFIFDYYQIEIAIEQSINQLLNQIQCQEKTVALKNFKTAVLVICQNLVKILASKKSWNTAVKPSPLNKPAKSKSSKLKITCSIATYDRLNSQETTVSAKARESIEQIHPWGKIDREARTTLIHGLQDFRDRLNNLRPSSSTMIIELNSMLVDLQIHEKVMRSQFLSSSDLEYLC